MGQIEFSHSLSVPWALNKLVPIVALKVNQQNWKWVCSCWVGWQISSAPIRVMKYNAACDVVVSADAKGLIEYWSPNSLEFPSHWYFPFHHQITLKIAQSCLKLVSLMFKFIRCKVYSFADGEQKLWTEVECNLVQSWEMEWVRGFWIVCSSNSRWTQTSTRLQRPGQLFILLRFGLHLFVVYSVEFSVLWLQMLF